METGHTFKAASLPAIVLLKLIAYDDRPDQRMKDAGDIASIMVHYFELQADLIYEKHIDLFDEEGKAELEEIAATVIGREIKEICAENMQLHQRLKNIIETEIHTNGSSAFLRKMVVETQKPVEEMRRLLTK